MSSADTIAVSLTFKQAGVKQHRHKIELLED
jgi:hypothetical protein